MMWKWALSMVLAGRMIAAAGTCATDPDGSSCLLIDGQTTGICKGGACTRTFTVPAGEARTGTGTISSSGGTVTGSGTAFLSELVVGDVIIAGGQRMSINGIASNTSLTTSPSFSPALGGGTPFTFANAIARFLDENGNTVVVIDSRGLVAIGQANAPNVLSVIGPVETANGAAGKAIFLGPGTGGPAGGGVNAGTGGNATLLGAPGGPSSSATLSTGNGGAAIVRGGQAPTNTGGGPNGTGGNAEINGGAGPTEGSILMCNSAGVATKIGVAAAMQISCATGGFTQIRGVTVSAFPPANAVGVMKNDGSGNYSLSAVAGADFATQAANTVFAGPSSGSAAAPTFRAVATADLPASVMNAVNAFVHANAGGI